MIKFQKDLFSVSSLSELEILIIGAISLERSAYFCTFYKRQLSGGNSE